jgi:hypothetical protein
LGPRTAAAGLVGSTWPVISQSNNIRTALSDGSEAINLGILEMTTP